MSGCAHSAREKEAAWRRGDRCPLCLREEIDALRSALGILLGDVDFTAGACRPTELVGAVLNPLTLKAARAAYEKACGAFLQAKGDRDGV